MSHITFNFTVNVEGFQDEVQLPVTFLAPAPYVVSLLVPLNLPFEVENTYNNAVSFTQIDVLITGVDTLKYTASLLSNAMTIPAGAKVTNTLIVEANEEVVPADLISIAVSASA